MFDDDCLNNTLSFDSQKLLGIGESIGRTHSLTLGRLSLLDVMLAGCAALFGAGSGL
jgi:hypothetical protein